MAAGLDKLIDFLLSEIALCGTQGASGADFQRFIEKYCLQDDLSGINSVVVDDLAQGGLGRNFNEKVWQWVTRHPDVRIVHNDQSCHYTLTEFEAAEKVESIRPNDARSDDSTFSSPGTCSLQPARPLLALRLSLRKRMLAERQDMRIEDEVDDHNPAMSWIAARHHPRIRCEDRRSDSAAFDEPTLSTSSPRLFASQNRIWQALTGHSMDLKKVPTMEFTLLSLIAAHGADGITQPDLVQFSGQDKRSVPHRTDELARKGYIIKKPVQAGKARTSLCVHTKFVSQNHFTTSGAVEDAFRLGTFVASSFVQLLYNTFRDAGVVLTRDLRKRMGVPMETWNKRAVQGALIRLDQSGMIRRFQIRKQKTRDLWVNCIEIQREPRPEDLENLGFRRQVPVTDATAEQFPDNISGESLMRNLESELLEDGDDNDDNNDMDDTARVPPQWTPDRILSNIIFDFTALGEATGWDAIMLRDRVVGPYWRRPVESYMTRLTDDWERMQPVHVRHLAIIRDTRTSDEKRFVHYVYRTYHHFQQAVRAGEADWGGVCKPANKFEAKSSQKKPAKVGPTLDPWACHDPSQKEFVRFNGTATLSDVRAAIAGPRKYGPRWDIPLAKDIGYDRANKPLPSSKTPRRFKNVPCGPDGSRNSLPDNDNAEDRGVDDDDASDGQPSALSVLRRSKASKTKKKGSGLTLTPEQRVSLGLKPSGRLSKSAANQILAHRQRTGDPMSLPEILVDDPVVRGKVPLMTKEERIAENLPPKGRLGLDKENEIREKRGMPKLVEKARKKRATKEPAILTKQQRIMLGLKEHGRLHQWFMDDLRREQENDIPLESSPAVQRYRDFIKAEETKVGARAAKPSTQVQTTPTQEHSSYATNETEPEEALTGEQPATLGPTQLDTKNPAKRKAGFPDTHISKKKKPPTKSSTQDHIVSPMADLPEVNSHCSTQKPLENLTVEKSVSPEGTSLPPLDSAPATSDALLIEEDLANTGNLVSDRINNGNTHGHAMRSLPGLYLYLSAKRKVSRGRPRNALLAIFRTSRLATMPWFTEVPSCEVNSGQIISIGPCKSSPTQNNVCDETRASAGPMNCVEVPSKLPTPQGLTTSSNTGTSVEQHPGLPFEPIGQFTAAVELQGPSQERELASRRNLEEVLSDPDAQVQANMLPSQPAEPLSETRRDQSAPSNGPKTIEEQATSRAVSGCNLINSSIQVTQPSYHSPYAQTDTAPPSHAAVTHLSNQHTVRMDSPDLATHSRVILPEGVVGEVLEEEDAEIAAHRKALAKNAATSAVGSALKFRREIILDIIDRCGGVYPLHGEIGRPFRALWNLRHGHTSLRVPENSTVQDTLKNMISNPAFGLKRMAFQVKARNATGRKLRAIVAKSDIALNDPRVMRLAYNMANHSTEKANQFFPQEIRDVFEYETLYIPPPVAPKDESFTLAQLFPEIESSIKENKIRRRQEKAAQKQAERAAAKKQNEQVEKIMPKRRAGAQSQMSGAQNVTREKRTRLASLNDKNKRYRRAPIQIGILDDMEEEARQAEAREQSPTGTDSSEDVPLMNMRPWQTRPIPVDHVSGDEGPPSSTDVEMVFHRGTFATDRGTQYYTHPSIGFHAATGTFSTQFGLTQLFDELLTSSITETLYAQSALHMSKVVGNASALTNPVIRFHATTGTFATLFAYSKSEEAFLHIAIASTDKSRNFPQGKKRVRLHAAITTARPMKRARRTSPSHLELLDEEFVYSSPEDTDPTSSEDEEDEPRPKQQHMQKKRRKITARRQLGKQLPTPTLLERLTGLTGDPNDPIYNDPKARFGLVSGRPRVPRKKKQLNKQRMEREYTEILDHAEQFKKLSLTLALASSMSGEGSAVCWSIVEKVYMRDKFFDIQKTKRIWDWMQTHMASQLAELIETFQANLLAAYVAGRLPAIENAETYDWAGLVRWTLRTCEYPELPLPLYREAIENFIVDESAYVVLDRVSWYGKRLADTGRTQLQLQLPFVMPMHRSGVRVSQARDNEVKARSWIRANIATPQSIYDAHLAHEKLEIMGESILSKVVGDFVQQEHLKMRKLKRQLPGRNYTFTKKFAKNYKRLFELEDFMVATTVKKELDTAFAREDAGKRFYNISRCEEDGSIMAIMSLVADGKVKLVPHLPPIDNEFGAPLPRLSKWGFCEGDYVHRCIDRNRTFWDTHVVPASDYRFGSPLQPLSTPAVDWPSLPEPPLPGRCGGDVLLPIWSSIDGQSVTWPWWYRILSLVLQPLFLQPAATPADIHSHCPEHTVEVFEVQLVLDWLESIGAISKTLGGGYQVTLSFWAVFGDRLLDTEDDIFGQHVKRNAKMTTKQQWRDKYNLRYSKLQSQKMRSGNQALSNQSQSVDAQISQQIIDNSRAQYSIIQQAMLDPLLEAQRQASPQYQPEEARSPAEDTLDLQSRAKKSLTPIIAERNSSSITPKRAPMPLADVEMVDTREEDAEGELDDMDAEGEVDEEMS